MNKRLASLDVMRGLTVLLMILVNNGVGPEQFHTLNHSQWNGLTLCDLVFPFFLFMVGVSIWISRNHLTPEKILTRTLKLFAVGLLLHVWDMLLDGQWTFWHDLRVWGVLQRIALCYGTCAFFLYYGKGRYLTILTCLAIVLYAALLCYGNGYAQDASNWLCRTDRWLFGEAHLYRKSPIDPEGLLGTIPSIAHTMIGIQVGRVITWKNEARRLRTLLVHGSSLLVLGLLLSIWFPLNKRIWSPSYVLVTCGIATLLLTLLILIEKKGHLSSRFSLLPISFGMNAFFLYVLSEMLAPIVSHWEVNKVIYDTMLSIGFNPRLASLGYALLFDALIALVAWQLWKRKIFIKI